MHAYRSVLLVVALFAGASAFSVHRSATAGRTAARVRMQEPSPAEGALPTAVASRREAASLAGALLFGATLASSAPAAFAIDKPAAKALFFRYSPRLESGISWFSRDLQRAVDGGDYGAVNKFFQQTPDNPKKKERSTSSSTAERDFYRPMNLLTGVFVNREKKAELLALAEQFTTAMDKLDGASRGLSGKKSGGFLGFFAKQEADVLKGRPQSVVTKEAYAEAKDALVKYVNALNDGLDFDLRRVEGPQ